MNKYFDFAKSKGIELSVINPGSKEIALEANDALEAINLIKECKLTILGGDVLSIKEGKLIYSYKFWGIEYHYLNWYCNKNENESQDEFTMRSYEIAIESINRAIEVSKSLIKDCYIVFVVI